MGFMYSFRILESLQASQYYFLETYGYECIFDQGVLFLFFVFGSEELVIGIVLELYEFPIMRYKVLLSMVL